MVMSLLMVLFSFLAWLGDSRSVIRRTSPRSPGIDLSKASQTIDALSRTAAEPKSRRVSPGAESDEAESDDAESDDAESDGDTKVAAPLKPKTASHINLAKTPRSRRSHEATKPKPTPRRASSDDAESDDAESDDAESDDDAKGAATKAKPKSRRASSDDTKGAATRPKPKAPSHIDLAKASQSIDAMMASLAASPAKPKSRRASSLKAAAESDDAESDDAESDDDAKGAATKPKPKSRRASSDDTKESATKPKPKPHRVASHSSDAESEDDTEGDDSEDESSSDSDSGEEEESSDVPRRSHQKSSPSKPTSVALPSRVRSATLARQNQLTPSSQTLVQQAVDHVTAVTVQHSGGALLEKGTSKRAMVKSMDADLNSLRPRLIKLMKSIGLGDVTALSADNNAKAKRNTLPAQIHDFAASLTSMQNVTQLLEVECFGQSQAVSTPKWPKAVMKRLQVLTEQVQDVKKRADALEQAPSMTNIAGLESDIGHVQSRLVTLASNVGFELKGSEAITSSARSGLERTTGLEKIASNARDNMDLLERALLRRLPTEEPARRVVGTTFRQRVDNLMDEVKNFTKRASALEAMAVPLQHNVATTHAKLASLASEVVTSAKALGVDATDNVASMLEKQPAESASINARLDNLRSLFTATSHLANLLEHEARGGTQTLDESAGGGDARMSDQVETLKAAVERLDQSARTGALKDAASLPQRVGKVEHSIVSLSSKATSVTEYLGSDAAAFKRIIYGSNVLKFRLPSIEKQVKNMRNSIGSMEEEILGQVSESAPSQQAGSAPAQQVDGLEADVEQLTRRVANLQDVIAKDA